MKNEFRKTMTIAFLLSGCLALSGCGSSSYSANKADSYYEESTQAAAEYGFNSYNQTQMVESAKMDDAAYAEEEDNVSNSSDAGTVQTTGNKESELLNQGPSATKKIIKTYHFSYDTEKFDEAYQYLREQVAAYDGYISSSDMYGTDLRELSLTARIPVDKCEGFVSQLGSLGTVVSQSESAEDVTLQYNDTESRIASLKTEQQRINELLKDADSLETIIALEERLTDVRYELENYQSQKNLYDDLITYCTVNISLSEVSYEVPVDDSTVLSRMKSGLVTSFRDIGYDFVNFIVWFVVASPYLVIWALVVFVIYRIIRRIVRKSKAKRLAKQEAKLAAKTQQTIQTVRPQNAPVNNNENQQNVQPVQKTEAQSQDKKENK